MKQKLENQKSPTHLKVNAFHIPRPLRRAKILGEEGNNKEGRRRGAKTPVVLTKNRRSEAT